MKIDSSDKLQNNNYIVSYPVDTGHKLNVHKTLCTFNLRPVSMG